MNKDQLPAKTDDRVHTEQPAQSTIVEDTPDDSAQQPMQADSTPEPPQQSGQVVQVEVGHEQSDSSVQVFIPAPTPPEGSSSAQLDETFFEPTLNDVRAHHASVVARSKRLNEAPLLTAKHRDAERAEREKRKSEKWPKTTIRIKFSDGTHVQCLFPSDSPIQPVYAFVRTTLDPSISSKPFVLWQPPRTQYPEKPPLTTKKPNPYRTTIIPPASYGAVRGGSTRGLQGGTGGRETLAELGLVPQSVLLVKWADETMNATGYHAPLLPELLERSVPLPAAVPKDEQPKAEQETLAQAGPKAGAGGSGEKKIPKWLQKGLMKRK